MAILEFFPESLNVLREELLKNHPDILAKIGMNAPLTQSLGEIAAILGIECDGYYKIDDFCNVLLVALKHRTKTAGSGIILPPGIKLN